ncbi:MAG: hypothetical protein GWN39_20145, partial [Thermoplasmata archaeon]|nr:hypothetical protein [Thermoplasmata archaeon]NIV80999.1 hypothetical protein [Thermoplasmata archaeon]NIW91130.1 hypothetical protein [Thermoplasmata archaeon]
PVGVVTDSSCDLPDPVVRAHGMGVVPLLLVDGDDVLLDRVEISAEEFHRKLGTAEALPTTSQPPPGTFVEAFREAS